MGTKLLNSNSLFHCYYESPVSTSQTQACAIRLLQLTRPDIAYATNLGAFLYNFDAIFLGMKQDYYRVPRWEHDFVKPNPECKCYSLIRIINLRDLVSLQA